MQRNTTPKAALACLIIGLLITTLMPITSRYLALPDLLKGFLTGLGLTLEFLAIVKMQKRKKGIKCAVSNN